MRRLFCFCQTPVLPSLANSLHLQLTGRELASDLSLEEAKEPLRQACLGKDVLLVLDDVWDASHVAGRSRLINDASLAQPTFPVQLADTGQEKPDDCSSPERFVGFGSYSARGLRNLHSPVP